MQGKFQSQTQQCIEPSYTVRDGRKAECRQKPNGQKATFQKAEYKSKEDGA